VSPRSPGQTPATSDRRAGERAGIRGWGVGLGRVLAATLVVASLPLYVSYENRPVLDRWSRPYAIALLLALLLWAACLWHWWRRRAPRDSAAGVAAAIVDAALLCLGVAYLLSALSHADAAARLFDLDLFGSTSPLPAALEGLALVGLLLGASAWALLRTTGAVQQAVLVGASLLALLSLGELGARAKAFCFPETQGFPTHASRIWQQRHVHANGRGYRDAEHAFERVGDVRRLAVVGDSYAFGAGIEDPAERFGEQLGAALASTSGTGWETLNVSRPDSHTLDHLRFLEHALEFQPDLVVLLYVFNDLDYLAALTARTALSEAPRGILQRLHPARVAFRNSYLFQEVYVRIRLIRYRIAEEPVRADPYEDPALLERHLRDLELFVARARQAGAGALVVPFDIAIAAQPGSAQRYRRFVEAARERGLPVCSLEGAFGEKAFAELAVNALDAHPNALAHRLAAQAALPCVAEEAERRQPESPAA
jgi:hypothetical protein